MSGRNTPPVSKQSKKPAFVRRAPNLEKEREAAARLGIPITKIAPKLPPTVIEEALKTVKKGPSPPPAPSTSTVAVSNVGNVQRTAVIRALLRMFAKSDFKHDFGERDIGRDLITAADRKRFQEMVQRFPVKDRVMYLNMFDKILADNGGSLNLYGLLSSTIASKLYPRGEEATAPRAEFKHEPDVMRDVGIEFEDELKAGIRAHFGLPAGTVPDRPPYSQSFTFAPSGAYEGAGTRRNYIVKAQRYKNANGTTRNLSSLFQDVTGASKFALLIDAMTGLSLSSIRDATLTPQPSGPCSFGIIKNVEGDADSATGVSNYPVSGAGGPVFEVLRDVGTSTVVFPVFPVPATGGDAGLSATEAENLFTQIKVILTRVEKGEIEATVLVGDESHTIPDAGTASNVKNASLNGLAAWFAKEMIAAANRRPVDERKPYIYALLKRMGDWCQALSLLDRTRTYTSVDPKTETPLPAPAGRNVTLQDLIADGYEVGIVTNDRILLAYATFLGLNVYYTSASDLGCLIYFKNQDDLPSIPSVQARTQDLYTQYSATFGDGGTQSITSLLTRAAATVGAPNYTTVMGAVSANLATSFQTQGVSPELRPGIAGAFTSKVILENLSQLRANFGDLQTKLTAAQAEYSFIPDTATDPTQVRNKYNAVTTLISLSVKLKTDVEHNESITNQLLAGKYSGDYDADAAIFVELGKKMNPGGRIGTSEAMKRAKDVILSGRDNIKQIKQKSLPGINLTTLIPSITAITPGTGGNRPTGRDMENFTTLYEAFDAVRAQTSATLTTMTGGGQRGGLRANLLRLVKQRVLFPYKNTKSFEQTAANLLTIISTPTTSPQALTQAQKYLELLNSLPAAKFNDYVRDEKNHPYSVVDKYLITKEDLRILEALVTDIYSTTLAPLNAVDWTNMKFSIARYLLLYHDILYGRLERLEDDPGPEKIADSAFLNAPGTDSAVDLSKKEEVKATLNREYTENYLVNIEALALEAVFLRILVSRLSNIPATYTLISEQRGELNTLLRLLVDGQKSGTIDMEVLGSYMTTTLAASDTVIFKRLFAGPRGPDVIDGEEMIGDGAPTALDRFRNRLRQTLENVRDSIIALHSKSPPEIDVGVPTPDETASGSTSVSEIATDVINNNLANDPDATPLIGSSRLQSAGDILSNDESSSSSVSSGGRRELYAGLRKRSGSGSPPGVRE
jgi:hypothetical protein